MKGERKEMEAEKEKENIKKEWKNIEEGKDEKVRDNEKGKRRTLENIVGDIVKLLLNL